MRWSPLLGCLVLDATAGEQLVTGALEQRHDAHADGVLLEDPA